ncbi:MAG: hypothetical protein R3B74_14985 [Nitrospirales bacterium]|nr:hypothetical protein [Nitrospirales bacterium]
MVNNRTKSLVNYIATTLQQITGLFFADAKRHEQLESYLALKPEGFKPIRIPIAGVQHHCPQWVLHSLSLNHNVWLHREINDFDVNAIAIKTDDGRKLGYVGRVISRNLASYLDKEKNPLQAVVTQLTRDVSGEVLGMAVGFYLPDPLVREIQGETRNWTSYCDVDADGVTYLFLDSDEAELEQVNEVLRHNGLPWRRSGLAYRVAPDGRQYRWYIRLDGDLSKSVLQNILEDTLGPSRNYAESSQVINEWMIEQFDEENRDLRGQLKTLQDKIHEIDRTPKPVPKQRGGSQRRELGNTIKVLLPAIHFLRDSLDVITEIESVEPILRDLGILCSAPAEIKGERVEGASPWKERRFSTGQKHDGRFYFKNQDSTWVVLISYKDCQKQDIAYLKKN